MCISVCLQAGPQICKEVANAGVPQCMGRAVCVRVYLGHVCVHRRARSAGAERLGVGDCACAGVGLWLRTCRQEVWVCRGPLLCVQSVYASVHVCVVAGAGVKALMPELWTGRWMAV